VSGAVTVERLLPHLEAWLASNPKRPVFAVHHVGDWTGSDQLVINERYVDVRVCVSELAIRELLSERRDEARGLVLLTSSDQLADDVLARLARPKVHRLHAHEALLPLFGVRSIDPALARLRWLVDALVDAAPVGGYEPAGALQLDLARAWRALLVHRHGIDADGGLVALLRWAIAPTSTSLAGISGDERDAVVARLAGTMPGADGVLAAVLTDGGEDAVALGLVLRALLDAPDTADRVAARTRLEVRLRGWAFDEASAAAWSHAAETLIDESGDGFRLPQQQRADRLVELMQAAPLVAHSDHLSAGLRARLALLGRVIDAWSKGKGTAKDVTIAADRVGRHRLAERGPAPHTMAPALVRWLTRDAAEPGDLRTAAAEHIAHGSYADWARSTLRHGAGDATLDGALRKLVAGADERREREERRFAECLAEWSSHAAVDDALLGVEHLLDRIVAPLARTRSLLVVVMDGMSHRVANELLDDLTHSGWIELRRATHPGRALVVSSLPSVTTLSRTSLLTGTLRSGTQADEQAAFPVHPALLASSGESGPPRLFHKGAVTDHHGGLAAELRAEVAGDRRIIGVVVNAIDEHLDHTDQLRTPWGVRDILPLRWLLEAAREAGRLVVLASDHGHVLEHGSELKRGDGDGGARWQTATGRALDAGEIVVQGTRVLASGGRCILAWSERLRYTMRKSGYHGGGSAQEVLTPLVVLAPDLVDAPDGWVEAPYDPPAWWLGDDLPPSVPVSTTRPAVSVPKPGEQMKLTADAELPASQVSDLWVAELLATAQFVAQRANAGRTPVPDERTTKILLALDAHGGRLLLGALARTCGIPAIRLTGTLAALRQMLNIDGYPVLTVDDVSGDVTLDRSLLEAQFGLTHR
jgi:hypothetical protein